MALSMMPFVTAGEKVDQHEQQLIDKGLLSPAASLGLPLALRAADEIIQGKNEMKLLDAAAEGALEEVQELIALGVSANIRDELGMTPLMLCGVHENQSPLSVGLKRENAPQVAECLINAKAAVNAAGPGAWTPLFYSSFYCELDVTRVLLEAKANVHVVDEGHRTVTSWVRYGDLDREHQKMVLKLLYSYGAPQPIEAKVKAGQLRPDFFSPVALEPEARAKLTTEPKPSSGGGDGGAKVNKETRKLLR